MSIAVISRGRMKSLKAGDKPPQRWGVYRFVNIHTGQYDYIGITSNLYERYANHRSRGRFSDDMHVLEYREALLGVTWTQMCEWEIQKIARHNPHLNIRRGGNGRRPQFEVNGQLYEVADGQSIGDALSQHGVSLSLHTTSDEG